MKTYCVRYILKLLKLFRFSEQFFFAFRCMKIGRFEHCRYSILTFTNYITVYRINFTDAKTLIFDLCHVKDHGANMNFQIKTRVGEELVFMLLTLGVHAIFHNMSVSKQLFKPAVMTLARFRIVTHSYAALFSKKTILCEIGNIFYLVILPWSTINFYTKLLMFSESSIKVKVRSRRTFFLIMIRAAVICI